MTRSTPMFVRRRAEIAASHESLTNAPEDDESDVEYDEYNTLLFAVENDI